MKAKITAASSLCMVATLTLACAPHRPPEGPMVLEEQSTAQSVSAPEVEIAIQRTRVGSISRHKLLQILDAGVGALLGTIEIEAYFEERSFWGWKIQQHNNEWVDLVPGDIVTSINGKRLETPAQVQAMWDSLRDSEQITVAAFRNEQPFELRFTVQGEGKTSSP